MDSELLYAKGTVSMLENDIYVNHSALSVTTQDELIEHMKRTLRFEGKDLQDAMLVLCAYCFYISIEEIALLYPNCKQLLYHLSGRTFKRLIDAKLVFSESINSAPEGSAVTLYCITKAGYDRANVLCAGRLTSDYKKNRARIAISHTYYIGYNLIQLLLLDYSVTWQREYLLNSVIGYKRGDKTILQIDSKAVLYKKFNQKPFMTVYVEQDSGKEKNGVLYGKLVNYAKLGLMDLPKSSLIMFSFSPQGVAYKKNTSLVLNHPYDKARLNKLLDYLENIMHLDNAYDAYVTGFPDRDFITTFLLKTGAGKRVKGQETLKRGDVVADIDFIKEFRDSLPNKTNPYQQKEYNLIRHSLTEIRFRDMLKIVLENPGNKEPFFMNLRLGYQVLYLPTTLVTDRLKFAIIPHKEGSLDSLLSSLTYLYESLAFKTSLPEEKIELDKGAKIKLRNEFADDSNRRVFVEFPAFDLGAWLRALYFVRLYKDGPPTDLVCVFESNSQLADFYEKCGGYMDGYSKDKSNVLCLMLYDIGRTDRLFYCSDNSLKKHFVRR